MRHQESDNLPVIAQKPFQSKPILKEEKSSDDEFADILGYKKLYRSHF